jgi:superfamily II DNA/RNA helicase
LTNAASIAIAKDLRHALADIALTERQAKLYSQRLRLDMGREGLATFAAGDVEFYVDEANLLLQCALLERRADPMSGWRDGIKRAAEILEWLSQSRLKPAGAPLHLLSAAAYQVADYPAMALGHLRCVSNDESFSVLLREFLCANFPATLEAIHCFWSAQHALQTAGQIDPEDLSIQTFRHVVMCIGSVCTYLRTGRDETVYRALTKLENLAAGFLHSRDPFSYLLAVLTAETCKRFVETSLWQQVDRLRRASGEAIGAALIQFVRLAFINKRALIWPAQAAGIERLSANSSFALCTPTGSGKTTIATLAMVQALSVDRPTDQLSQAGVGPGNLILYLVPSRALAAEVESRLAQDLQGITAEPVVVTGLYGGADWGPTDIWVQTNWATVVICTFEKADALLHYLGALFIERIRLIIIDEAHMVEQDQARLGELKDASSRAFRLEQLGARLLRARDRYGFRVLALSAVATRAAPALARWISGSSSAVPTISSYRSTRQMLGRLEVSLDGQYLIRYDLMDGRSLKFKEGRREETPYVPNPFLPLPGGIDVRLGPEARMKAPTLWAALQLAAERPDGSKPAVLISLTQNIEAFSATSATLMESWPEESLPNYSAVNEDNDLWTRCLASAADYFSVNSVEYRLLKRGIAVHHGKMPGLLARRLKTVIDNGFIRVIIATSTLSEGVNLPINFLLIPNIFRGANVLTLQEFTNLIGRTGRPGFATEGIALVMLPERMSTLRLGRRILPTLSRQWVGYKRLVTQIEKTTIAAGQDVPEDKASSPLAHLLRALESEWAKLTGGGTNEEFLAWLEQTAIVNVQNELSTAYDYLDTLDAFLIATIQEVEALGRTELGPDEVEAELTAIWRRTYAYASGGEQERLAGYWLARGRAIMSQYPNQVQRRRIYRTNLSPRSARILLDLKEAVRTKLSEGIGYALWSAEERFAFVRDVLDLLSKVPSFQFGTTLGRQRDFHDWPKVLRWWLAKGSLSTQPRSNEITRWYEFVAQNFIYRSAWGIGSVIGLMLEASEEERPVQALEIGDWPRTSLPWIAFWLKELIVWGTLDPVAAFLLARGGAVDRQQAENDARVYYEGFLDEADANIMLDPRRVREWVNARRVQEVSVRLCELSLEVELSRPVADYLRPSLTVTQIEVEGGLIWIDSAGYIVARSGIPLTWPDNPSSFDFTLDIAEARITGKPYLQYHQRNN